MALLPDRDRRPRPGMVEGGPQFRGVLFVLGDDPAGALRQDAVDAPRIAAEQHDTVASAPEPAERAAVDRHRIGSAELRLDQPKAVGGAAVQCPSPRRAWVPE